MYIIMNWWLRLGCYLIGWNNKILVQCSEASYKHLKKYTSALLILMIMWGFTGFCFAQRYVHAPLWGCILSSLIFVTIIVQIERQIILTVGRSKTGVVFRIFIAVIMAVLGSAILDQVIFGEDVKRKMVEMTDKQVTELLPVRLKVIEDKLAELQQNIDSLDRMNLILNDEIAKNPTTKTVSTSTIYKNVLQEDGTYKKIPETTVSTIPVANPRIKQVETNNMNLERFRKQQDEYTTKKLEIGIDLREELSANVGFLEELHAMLEILKTRKEALLFYCIIFSFLISLELFVVIGKMSDKKCDYDMIVEYQLHIKETTFGKLANGEKIQANGEN